MKRKITLSTLNELSCVISHDNLASYLGGGSGTQNDPFSFSEYMTLGWAFTHGWVKMSDGSISYLTENYFSYSGCTDNCYNGTSNYWGSSWMFNNSDYYYGSSASSSSTLEKALTGAGISVGVEAFLMDLAQAVCKSDAARQSITKAMEESLEASKIAGKFSKGCGIVSLVFSLPDGINSFSAVINGTGDTADWLNVASIGFGAVGLGCSVATAGAATPIGIVCGGISVTLSVTALVVDE